MGGGRVGSGGAVHAEVGQGQIVRHPPQHPKELLLAL